MIIRVIEIWVWGNTGMLKEEGLNLRRSINATIWVSGKRNKTKTSRKTKNVFVVIRKKERRKEKRRG